jgi:PhnB protein
MAQVHPIPKGMHTITANLVCKEASKAIEFYKNAFGAVEVMRMPTPDGKGIWHAELRIGDSVFYVNDEMPNATTHAPTPEHPATASIQLYVDDADGVFWRATTEGALSTMPVQEMFWGDRMGAVTDPFGHTWMISTHTRDLTEEEVRRGAEEYARHLAQEQSGGQGA